MCESSFKHQYKKGKQIVHLVFKRRRSTLEGSVTPLNQNWNQCAGSVRVYTEAFRLELLEADRLRKRRSVLGLSCESDLPEEQDKRDSILEGQLAVLFYDDCTKKATSASDLVPFLAVAKEFDFTADIQKRIFEWVQTLLS